MGSRNYLAIVRPLGSVLFSEQVCSHPCEWVECVENLTSGGTRVLVFSRCFNFHPNFGG